MDEKRSSDEVDQDSAARDAQMIAAAREQIAEEDQTLDSPGSSGPWFAGPPADSFVGYRILKEVHRGGQGVVYRAFQESTKREIAIKVLKEGPFSSPADKARFDREVEVLGQLHHPNIVAVHDTGVAAGCHFFVMDYVSGQPLDRYIASGEYTIDETLRLFDKICVAVNAAHLRGVIHRDLKPSNIRVDADGEPHILDFGLAKLAYRDAEASAMTMTGQFLGSLPWASPEQAEGAPSKIDLRTDVYALGVILYQMLTARFPYDVTGNMRDALDNIMTAEPARPSTIRRQINDEVETIVLKCLQKDRDRRYQSAGELAGDVRHYLSGEPIEAKRDSIGYVLRKQLKRYRVPTAIAASFLVLLVAFSLVMTVMYQRAVDAEQLAETRRIAAEQAQVMEVQQRRAAEDARREAQRSGEQARLAEADAEQRAAELEQVSEFQASQLSEIDPQLMGVRLRRALLDAAPEPQREALEPLLTGINFTNLALGTLKDNLFQRTIDAIDEQFAEQPLVQARLLQTVAETLIELGLPDQASDPQEQALQIRLSHLGDEHPDTLTSISDMGLLLSAQGKLAEAEPYYRESLEKRQRLLGDEHPDTIISIGNMGNLLHAQGKLAEAGPYCREAMEKNRRVLGDEHPDTLGSVSRMGVLLQSQGKLTEAEPYFREALEKRRSVLGDEHPDTLASIDNMGTLLWMQGKQNEAEPYFREALEKCRRVLGDDHPDTLTSTNNMGVLLRMQDKLGEAEPYFREALEKRRRVLGNEHPHTLGSINNMGALLRMQGKLAEAEPYYRDVLEKCRRILGDEHPNTLRSLHNIGVLLGYQGKLREAERYCREALDKRRRVLGDEHPDTLQSINHMGYLLDRLSRHREALDLLREGEDAARRVWTGANAPGLAVYLGELGEAQRGVGDFAAGEAAMLEAHRLLTQGSGENHERTVTCIERLVSLYEAWDVAEPGRGYAEKAAEWRAKLPTPQPSEVPSEP